MNILENIYYITAIIVSFGVFRGFFNLFKISSKHETLFISNFYKKILKLFYFVKTFIKWAFIYSYLYFIFWLTKDIFLIICDFIVCFGYIEYCDSISIFFRHKKFMPLYIEYKKISFFIMSICVTLIFYFIRRIIGVMPYTIIQTIFFWILFCYIKKQCESSKNFILNFSFKFFIAFITPILVKLLFAFTYTPLNNDNTVSIFEVNVIETLANIFYCDNFIYIISGILALTLFCSKWFTDVYFGYKQYIFIKNKAWQISYITNDNYALCTCNNFTIMVNVDVIKNFYMCVYDRGNYVFYEKDESKEVVL